MFIYADDTDNISLIAGIPDASDDHEFTSIGIKCERKNKRTLFGNLSDTDFKFSGNLTLDPRDFDKKPKFNLSASANQKIYGATVEIKYQYDATKNSHATTFSLSWKWGN